MKTIKDQSMADYARAKLEEAAAWERMNPSEKQDLAALREAQQPVIRMNRHTRRAHAAMAKKRGKA